jgi:hypothetical protein
MYLRTGLNNNSPARASPPKNIIACGDVIATASASVCPSICPVNSKSRSAKSSPLAAARCIFRAVMLSGSCSSTVCIWLFSYSHSCAVRTMPVADA